MNANSFLIPHLHTVYALDILPTPLPAFQSLQNLAPLYGSSLYYLHLDVTSEHSVSSTISHIARTHGRLDGLICSAGILTETNALDCPASTFTKTLDVNTTGVFLCAQAAAREMILRSQKHTSQDQAGEEESSSQLVGGGGSGGRTSGPSIHHHQQQQKGGTILLVASMSASIANRGVDMAAYNASKAAVVGLSRCLAAEWGRAGIRVNCLSPGYVVTKMVEKGLQGREERRREWEDANMLGRLSCPEEYR